MTPMWRPVQLMSNSANSPGKRAALPLLLVLAGAALVVYLLLLNIWQGNESAPLDDALNTPGEASTQLELSRELSPAGQGIAGARPVTDDERGWLMPVAAFVVPLGVGFLWGWWAKRKASEGLSLRELASAHGVSWDDEDLIEMATTPVRELLASAQSHDNHRAQEPHGEPSPAPLIADYDDDDAYDHHDAVADHASEEELLARLSAKDEVIEALETIVKENRDEWEAREREASESKRRIERLEAELAAASHLIDGASVPAASAVRPQPSVDAELKPQVMARNG